MPTETKKSNTDTDNDDNNTLMITLCVYSDVRPCGYFANQFIKCNCAL